MRNDEVPTKHMPVFLLMVLAGIALFLAIAFYLFYAPGKTTVVKSPPAGTGLLGPGVGPVRKLESGVGDTSC